jgi:DNA-binding beta-propeller fold protein YncE
MFRFRTNPEFRALLTAGRSSTFGYLLAAGVGLVVALFVLMAFSASRGGADEPPEIFFELPSETCLLPTPKQAPTDACYPEGIAADNDSGTFYVSSFSTGSISSGNVNSPSVPLEVFLPGSQDDRTRAIGLKLDDEGQLYIAGGDTRKVFIYDTASKELVSSFDAPNAGFLNDLAINPQTGDTYITDSFVPTLWRISGGQLKPWLDLSHTPIRYREGFNLNGIVSTPDGRYLLTVQSNTGKLYRIDTQTEQVTPVDLGGAKLTNGDGLVLTGNTLYVIRNQGFITKISLGNNFKSGEVVEDNITVPSPTDEVDGDFPTTGALVGGRLLVVNSQFDEGGPVVGADPEIPFTVSAMDPAP